MNKTDLFGRAAGLIADLGSPFYTEERQRDVWNESSAVGFQTMLWGGLGLSCAMIWVGGRPLVGWTVAGVILRTANDAATFAGIAVGVALVLVVWFIASRRSRG